MASREDAASSAERLLSPVRLLPCGTTEPVFFFLSTMWPTSLSGGSEPDGDQRACGMQHMLRTIFSDHVYGGGVGRNSPFFKKKKKEREETSHCLTARGLIYRVYWQRRNSHSPALFLELPHPLFVRKGEVGGRTWNEMVQPFPYLSFKWSDLSLLV